MIAIANLLHPNALTRYDEHGDPLYTVHERVLLALRRLEWATSREITATAGLGKRHADAAAAALARLVRAGQAERRGTHNSYRYQIVAKAFADRRWRAQRTAAGHNPRCTKLDCDRKCRAS